LVVIVLAPEDLNVMVAVSVDGQCHTRSMMLLLEADRGSLGEIGANLWCYSWHSLGKVAESQGTRVLRIESHVLSPDDRVILYGRRLTQPFPQGGLLPKIAPDHQDVPLAPRTGYGGPRANASPRWAFAASLSPGLAHTTLDSANLLARKAFLSLA